MDSTIIVALIGAVTTIITAVIGTLATRSKDKKIKYLQNSVSQTLLPDEFGIEISKPTEYEIVGNSFEVQGRYENLPEPFTIWLITFRVGEDGIIEEYWPQSQAKTSGGKWSGHVYYIGGNPGEIKEFWVLVVGKDGQTLFQYYQLVGEITGSWPGIPKMTTDTILCKKGLVRIGE